MKRLVGLAAIAVYSIFSIGTVSAQEKGYWVFIPETSQQLYYISPQTRLQPDKDMFYPVVGYNMQPIQTTAVFCDTFRQAISMEVRRREGKDLATALGYMEGAWGGKKVCRYETVKVTPIAYAERGDDLNLPVLLIRWRTTDGRILYNGQYNF